MVLFFDSRDYEDAVKVENPLSFNAGMDAIRDTYGVPVPNDLATIMLSALPQHTDTSMSPSYWRLSR